MPATVWWEIETPDPSRFQRFHGALLGWTFESAFADTELGIDYWVIRDDGHAVGGLQQAVPVTVSVSTGVRVYVEVDDLEVTLARAVQLGGTIERGRLALGGDDHWCAVFRDATGLSLGLWTRRPAAPAT